MTRRQRDEWRFRLMLGFCGFCMTCDVVEQWPW